MSLKLYSPVAEVAKAPEDESIVIFTCSRSRGGATE